MLPTIPTIEDHLGLSLPLRDDLPFEKWLEFIKQIIRVEKGVMWVLGDALAFGERRYGKMYETALKNLDYSYDTLKRAVWVGNQIEKCRRRHHLSWSHHLEVAALPPDQQDEFLDIAEKESISTRDLRRKVRELKNDETRKRIEVMPPPPGKFKTVVIDPPWPMAKIIMECRPNQVEFPYPVMSLDEIYDLHLGGRHIKELFHDECHVFLWCTQKYEHVAYDILKSWGVTPFINFVWHKPGGFQPTGLPQYNCEFIRFGRWGGLPFMDTKAFPTCFNAPRREHSRKPDYFYDLVKRVSPGPRIDVFSRESRDGFESWGPESDLFAKAG